MFKIRVSGEFSAAHAISGYNGDCARLHGHNWRVLMTIESDKLDELDLACDFRVAKGLLESTLSEFDHKELNRVGVLAGGNPTSERIARAIFEMLKPKIPKSLKLYSVEVFESDKSSVEYSEK